MEQRAHLYTLAGVCALPRAYLRTGRFPRAPIWRLCRNKGLHPLRRFAAIPAHPQKQYTRRWRLYHFCGFYYPIREVIPIAIYHWNVGIVSRGKGKSAVAAAAYRSGEKLTNEWDGMTHDYTRKGGVVHTEIMLPPHAPPSFSDRSTLWNSVELYEKAGNAQLAREIDAALPIELSREEQIRLVREYCSSQFVSRGMCVDYAIHDTDKGNIAPDPTGDDLTSFFETIARKNWLDFDGVTFSEEDTVLTLSTCCRKYDKANSGNQRLVVMAKLLPEGATAQEFSVSLVDSPEMP